MRVQHRIAAVTVQKNDQAGGRLSIFRFDDEQVIGIIPPGEQRPQSLGPGRHQGGQFAGKRWKQLPQAPGVLATHQGIDTGDDGGRESNQLPLGNQWSLGEAIGPAPPEGANRPRAFHRSSRPAMEHGDGPGQRRGQKREKGEQQTHYESRW